MRKPISIPASLDEHERAWLTQGQWLRAQMDRRRVACGELFERMVACGFEAQSPNIVSLWRADTCKVGLETLPKMLEGLGMDCEERRAWVIHFTGATYPALVPYLRMAV